jgi:hypothetical protein
MTPLHIKKDLVGLWEQETIRQIKERSYCAALDYVSPVLL